MLGEVLRAYSGMLHVVSFDSLSFRSIMLYEECLLNSNKLVIQKPLMNLPEGFEAVIVNMACCPLHT